MVLDLWSYGEIKVKNFEDLFVEIMVKDVGNVVEVMYGDFFFLIMLIGYSMGGVIVVYIVLFNLVLSFLGLCMIDVVEGIVMDVFNSM